jgi:tetratricopeptide (TPR) repeat protein
VKLGWLFALLCWSQSILANDFTAAKLAIAKDPAKAASELSQQVEQKPTAELWFQLSIAYLQLSNKDAALQSIESAIKLASEPTLAVQLWEHKALVYGVLFRDTKAAIGALGQAEKLLEQLEPQYRAQAQTSIYESYAQAYNQLGNIAEATRFAELSIAIATENQLADSELQGRLIAGRLALQQNNFAMTQMQLSRALTLAQQLGTEQPVASIHLRLGMAYRKLEQYPLSLEHLLLAEQLYLKKQNIDQHIYTQVNIAQTYLQMKDGHKADAVLAKALAAAEQQQDAHMIALVNYGRSQLAILNSELEQAKTLLHKALQYYSQLQNDSMRLELQLALVEVLIKLQDLPAAAQAFPQLAEFGQTADFLKNRYWALSAQLFAAKAQWQDAYQASEQVGALNLSQLNLLQKNTLDLLQQNLMQQQQQQQLKQLTEQNQQWQMVSLLLVCLLVAVLLLSWRFRRPTATIESVEQGAMPIALSWHDFTRKVQRHRQEALHLQSLQLAEPQLLKFRFGEQPMREAMQNCLASIPAELLAGYTVHTDALWLVWRCPPDQLAIAQQQLLSQLQQLQQQFPSEPALFSFMAPIAPLLGAHWQASDLTGLRELIWLGWASSRQQHPNLSLYKLVASSQQPAPCSWSAASIRQDIVNALKLGLLELSCNGQALPKPQL